jgi:hypothetical protein
MTTVEAWHLDFHGGHGEILIHANFGVGNVCHDSGVFASICEVSNPGEPNDIPFIGAAKMTINNIAPRDDGIVDVWVTVNWNSDLIFKLEFLLVK